MSRASIANIEVGRQRLLVHQLYLLAAALKLDDAHLLMPVAGQRQDVPKTPMGGAQLTQRQREQIDRLVASFVMPEQVE